MLPGGDIKEQTERILKQHKANLEAMGSSLENVIKVTVFLADVKTEKSAMNEVYAKYFPKDPPSVRLSAWSSRTPRRASK